MNCVAEVKAGRKAAPNEKTKKNRRLELYVLRTAEIAERAYSGSLPFLDAVDLAYDVAVGSGLEADFGADSIQKVMAAAFASAANEVRP